MKILMLSSYLPYPLYSGGHIRLFNIVKELSKRHEITLICEQRPYQTNEDIGEVRKFCKEVIAIPRKKQWSLPNILKTGFSSYPFLLVGHTNPLLTRVIQDKLKEGFDLSHIETFYVMQNLPKVDIPTVLVEHNIEHMVYERYKKKVPFFLQPLLTFDIAKMKYWEEFFWNKATKLVAVSEVEKKQMGRNDVKVVPNGVDVEKFRLTSQKPEARSQKRILFIGDFRWIQNRDAVEWILSSIWPLIRLKVQSSHSASSGQAKLEVVLWIVGMNIPDSIKQLTVDPNVFFDEHAPEKTEEIYKQADILLAPIRVGGGTSYKILESMASGVVVVTTPLGIEGIDAKDNEEVLLGETKDELVENILRVLEDSSLAGKLIKNARAKIEERYDWKIIVKQLEKVYEEITVNSREY